MINPFDKPNTESKPTAGRQSVADIIDKLGEDDDKTSVDKGDKDKKDEKLEEEEPDTTDKDDEDVDDEDDIDLDDTDTDDDEEETDEDESDKDDEVEIDAPPKKKEILAAYPDFFKKFPAVEKMIYRDRQYTEMFGSFDDAKAVYEKVEEFNQLEANLLSGSTEDVLKTLKEGDTKAFDKVVDDYIEVLKRVDEGAYKDVLGNIVKRISFGMLEEAKRLKERKPDEAKELAEHARALYEYIFDTDQMEDVKIRSSRDTAKEDEVSAERRKFTQERFEFHRDDLQTKVDNVLRSKISEFIDPRGKMSSFEKKTAIDKAVSMLHETVGSDKAFVKNLDRLWRAAFGSKFNQKDLDKIRSSYLGKSKGVLGGVIKKVRTEVLKDKTTSSEEREEKPTSRKTGTNAGRPPQQNKTKANERKPGESVMDFMMRD